MIQMNDLRWFEIREHVLDDSTGPIEDPPFEVTRTGNVVALTFNNPAEETMFRLRWTE